MKCLNYDCHAHGYYASPLRQSLVLLNMGVCIQIAVEKDRPATTGHVAHLYSHLLASRIIHWKGPNHYDCLRYK